MPPFNMGPSLPVILEIPEEFALYILGAVDYHNQRYIEAKTCFYATLALEPEKRKFKTVWAAYMLGRTCLMLNELDEAKHYFEQTRMYVEQGYSDPLALAAESWGWQGRAHFLAGEHLQATQAYIEYRKIPGKWHLTKASFYAVFRSVFKNEHECAELVHDVQARQLVTAWLTGMNYWMDGNYAKRWLEINAALPSEGIIEGADGLAWLAYNTGDMNAALRWVNQSLPDSFHARFVQAKLLLREGKIEEGNSILEALLHTTSGKDMNFYEHNYRFSVETVLRSAFAASLLKSDLYFDALKEMMRADMDDSAFIATHIMTIPELQDSIQKIKEDESLSQVLQQESRRNYWEPSLKNTLSYMEGILAQRMARSGNWAGAAAHFYEKEVWGYYADQDGRYCNLSEEALSVGNHLKEANNTSLSDRDRAEHFFAAAKIIRGVGVSLLGEWGLSDEKYDPSKSNPGDSLLTENSKRRILKNQELFGRKFQYRFLAADLMKQCADLLPDNNVLTAEALYHGGVFLKDRHPESADYFYKALVRRNPNLLIAKQADELRWFPREFTDTILYTPYQRNYFRKRSLVMLFGLGILLAAVAVAFSAVKRKRNKVTPKV